MRKLYIKGLVLSTLVSTLAPSTGVAYTFSTEMLTMRDGVKLATDVFGPSRRGVFPTVLIRTPYGKDMIPPESAKLICDGLGYILVVQDTRGTGASEGINDVFMSDGWSDNQDGYDTVDWVVAQRNSDKKVGLFGLSALGIASYMAMGTYHPAIKAGHVGIAPWIFYNTVYQGGVYRDALVTNWLEDNGGIAMLPLYQEHPVYDELWETLDLRTRAEGINIPIFHWGGYYDIFTEGPVDAFSQMSQFRTDQQLLMGPWTHMDNGAFSAQQGALTYPVDSILPMDFANPITFFDGTLKGRPTVPAQPVDYPVRFYVMGDVNNPASEGNHWEIAQEWPIPFTERSFYLQPDGSLKSTVPAGSGGTRSFTYNPADPSPTIGGNELYLEAGPYDQSSLYARPDVLRFTSEVLTAPVKVVGKVKVELYVSSTAPDTDFHVRFVDVYPDESAMLINDGILKLRYRDSLTAPTFLTPGQVDTVLVETGTTAITFDIGHRIEVLVSSSNAPRFMPSKNTNDSVWGTAAAQTAVNSVHLSSSRPSRLILPEPVPGETRPAPRTQVPSSAQLRTALRHLERGQPLSSADRQALSYEGGRRLMQAAVSAASR